jgi:LacI family transcriptional regulator
VAEHLVACGHRCVAVANGSSLHKVSDPLHPERPLLAWHSSELFERREAGLAALAACGLHASEIVCDGTSSDWATTVVERLRPMLDRSDRPTALLTDSDLSAHPLHTALSRAGIRVPEDLSLCAVAGSAGYAQRESLHITCCHMDFLGMGRLAAERLVARCAAPAAEGPVRQRVGFAFAAGTTTGPPAAASPTLRISGADPS